MSYIATIRCHTFIRSSSFKVLVAKQQTAFADPFMLKYYMCVCIHICTNVQKYMTRLVYGNFYVTTTFF